MSGEKRNKRDDKSVLIEISIGELVDRITILELKCKRIRDELKRDEAERQLRKMETVLRGAGIMVDCLREKMEELRVVNSELWNLENRVRDLEAEKSFGAGFVETAREIYQKNSERHALKEQINKCTDSMDEVKEYTASTKVSSV